MKTLKLTTLAALATLSTACAAPLQWVCDWPEAKSQTFALYQGETATFEPIFRVNGAFATNIGIEAVWYQTNGMANAWWRLDNATFAPTNDVGATAYRFFVAARDDGATLYRANGTLRMLPSPGYRPNALPPPVHTLDFAEVEVLNPPWVDGISENAASIAVNAERIVDVAAAATNHADSAAEAAYTRATNACVAAEYGKVHNQLDIVDEGLPGLKFGWSFYALDRKLWHTEMCRRDGAWAERYAFYEMPEWDGDDPVFWTCKIASMNHITAATNELARTLVTPDYAHEIMRVATNALVGALGDLAWEDAESDPTVPSWAKEDNKPTYGYGEIVDAPTNISAFANDAGYLTEHQSLADYATTGEVAQVARDLTTATNALAETMGDLAWKDAETDPTTAYIAPRWVLPDAAFPVEFDLYGLHHTITNNDKVSFMAVEYYSSGDLAMMCATSDDPRDLPVGVALFNSESGRFAVALVDSLRFAGTAGSLGTYPVLEKTSPRVEVYGVEVAKAAALSQYATTGEVASVTGDLVTHVADTGNPHHVTAAQTGAYVKPASGIPLADLHGAVQTNIALAATAEQPETVRWSDDLNYNDNAGGLTGIWFRPRAFGMADGAFLSVVTIHTATTMAIDKTVVLRIYDITDTTVYATSTPNRINAVNADVSFAFQTKVPLMRDTQYILRFCNAGSGAYETVRLNQRVIDSPDLYFGETHSNWRPRVAVEWGYGIAAARAEIDGLRSATAEDIQGATNAVAEALGDLAWRDDLTGLETDPVWLADKTGYATTGEVARVDERLTAATNALAGAIETVATNLVEAIETHRATELWGEGGTNYVNAAGELYGFVLDPDSSYWMQGTNVFGYVGRTDTSSKPMYVGYEWRCSSYDYAGSICESSLWYSPTAGTVYLGPSNKSLAPTYVGDQPIGLDPTVEGCALTNFVAQYDQGTFEFHPAAKGISDTPYDRYARDGEMSAVLTNLLLRIEALERGGQ